MRIAIDAHAIGEKLTGNETYISNIIEQIAGKDNGHEIILFFTRPEAEAAWRNRYENIKTRLLRPANPVIRIPVVMPLLTRALHADLLHVQYAGPPIIGTPLVTSVHDIAYEHYPEFFTRKEVIQFKLTIPTTARKAVKVLTLSEFCKRDIAERYSIPEDKIVVTYAGVDERFQPSNGSNGNKKVKKKYGIEGRYILTVGNLQPRKNLVRLMAAYSLLRKARPDIDHKLVIVGKKAWKFSPILASANKSSWSDDIILTGYVDDSDLPDLYRGADVMVYPSVFEGFGLPPLEAMACGTPVIVANRTSLPEVVGDDGILINPYDTEEMTAAMASLLLNKDVRELYGRKGVERAKRFSWANVANTCMEAYQEAAESEKRS